MEKQEQYEIGSSFIALQGLKARQGLKNSCKALWKSALLWSSASFTKNGAETVSKG